MNISTTASGKPRQRCSWRVPFPAVTAILLLTMLNALPGWSQSLVRDLGMRSIEGAWTSITLTSESTGLLETQCTDCRETESVLLTVDALSRILHNHEPITFAEAAAIGGGGRDVVYDPNAMRLVTLSIVTRN